LFDTFKTRSLLREHDDRITTVERQCKSMQIEWANTLDQLRGQLLRIRKERERIEAAQPESSPPENLSDEDIASGQTTLDPISARILARRNRLGRRGEQ